MSDPCPNPAFDATPNWAPAREVRATAAEWFARFGNVDAESVLLPMLVAALACAGFLVLAALHTV